MFKPIDIDTDAALCVKFRADSFGVSFGDAARFFRDYGPNGEKYLAWLRGKSEADPWSCVHLWRDGKVIGQLELGYLNTDSSIGYISLYYLIPEVRGSGIGKILDDYVAQYFFAKDVLTLRLSVSPSNHRALSFYDKHGWRDLGPRTDHPEVNFMEKTLTAPP